MSINEAIEAQKTDLTKLSKSRQRQLASQARCVPAHMKNATTFWRGLSASHVLAVLCNSH